MTENYALLLSVALLSLVPMKHAPQWLTRSVAERQLGVTPQQFVNLRTEGRITGHSRPGFKRPAYQQAEITALKKQLANTGGGAA